MLNSDNIDIDLSTLKATEIAFIDPNTGKTCVGLFTFFNTQAIEVVDATGYKHTVPAITEFKVQVQDTFSFSGSTSTPGFSKSATKILRKALQPTATSNKATVINKLGKPTIVTVKSLGIQNFIWPYQSVSFIQGDLVIDARR